MSLFVARMTSIPDPIHVTATNVSMARPVVALDGKFMPEGLVGGLALPQGKPSYVRTTGEGLVLTDECFQALGLESVREQVNTILSDAQAQYIQIEATHADIARSGDTMSVTLEPFLPDAEKFLAELWANLDSVLSESQQTIARMDLPLARIFGDLGFGGPSMQIRVQKQGDSFEYKIEHTLPGHGSGMRSGGGSTVVAELLRFWKASDDTSHGSGSSGETVIIETQEIKRFP